MVPAPRPWTVLPHEKLEKLEPNLWSVQADLGRWSKVQRRMFVGRLSDGRLAFINAIPLEEPFMRELEEWGTPSFLLVPAGTHRQDIHAWKERYPQMQLLTAAAFHEKVQKVAPVDGGWELIPRDPRLRLIVLRGTRGEIAIRSGGTLCFPGDVFMNQPDMGGVEGLVFRLLGSTGGPRITRIARLFVVDDRETLREELNQLAAEPGIERIVPCHGGIIRLDIKGVLRRAAASL